MRYYDDGTCVLWSERFLRPFEAGKGWSAWSKHAFNDGRALAQAVEAARLALKAYYLVRDCPGFLIEK